MGNKSPASATRLIICPLAIEKNRFEYYWPRLETLAVQTPRSRTIALHQSQERRVPTWDTDLIRSTMREWDLDRAFVRSQFKAAPRRLRDGSHIQGRDAEAVDRTVRSLLHQLETTGWNHGGSLVLREWLDLEFCIYPQHEYCHPEIRFFIEDGEIIGSTPHLSETSFVCQGAYGHLEPELVTLGESSPRQDAQRVAAEFTEDTWAVDFAMDTSGDWYCIEMGLNAVRWDDQLEDWINHCDHGHLAPYSPREMHSPALHQGRLPKS